LKDASNGKYYKHLQVTHFSFQDMHNVNIYISMKMTMQMQDFSFVHKYAFKMQVKKKKTFISFQAIQVCNS